MRTLVIDPHQRFSFDAAALPGYPAVCHRVAVLATVVPQSHGRADLWDPSHPGCAAGLAVDSMLEPTRIYDIKTAQLLEDVLEVTGNTIPSAKLKPVSVVLVQVGRHHIAEEYARATRLAAASTNVELHIEHLDSSSSHNAVAKMLQLLILNPEVHGVALQLPLPDHLDEARLLDEINGSGKDIDGLCASSLHHLFAFLRTYDFDDPAPDYVGSVLVPALPIACEELLKACVQHVERSPIVVLLMGVPSALLTTLSDVMSLAGHCVQICSAATPADEARAQLKRADALIVGTSRADVIAARWIPPGCIILDLGLSVASTPPSPVISRHHATDEPPSTAAAPVGGAVDLDEPMPQAASVPAAADGPASRWGAHAQQQAVRCLGCHDGLARRVAALRLQNACRVSLVQQGFMVWEAPHSRPATRARHREHQLSAPDSPELRSSRGRRRKARTRRKETDPDSSVGSGYVVTYPHLDEGE